MILVTGASGLLGANFILAARDRGLTATGVYLRHAIRLPGVECLRADLSDQQVADEICRSLRPKWIVDCAALTNVDWCEEHPQETWEINVGMSRHLAATARALGAGYVYLSTDSVFDGKTGAYRETDPPAPLNVYARSKYAGEQAVAEAAPGCLIVRTNFFGWNVQEKLSLAEWILSRLEAGSTVPAFRDVVFSPLLANDLSRVILDMMAAGLSGVYHLGALDACSKHHFALKLAETFALDSALVQETFVADSGLRSPRPRNTSLRTDKLRKDLSCSLPTVDQALQRFKNLRDAGFVQQLKSMGGA